MGSATVQSRVEASRTMKFMPDRVAVALTLLLSVSAWGQDLDARLEKMRADWKKRMERVKAVLYRTEGESRAFKDALNKFGDNKAKPVFLNDVITHPKYTLLLDFPKQRHRLTMEKYSISGSTGKVTKDVVTRIFDGEKLLGQRHRDPDVGPKPATSPKDADAGIGKGTTATAPFDETLWPFFLGHGIVGIGVSEVRLFPGKFKIEPDMEGAYIHGKAVHRGRSCIIVRTHARAAAAVDFDEYWVDLERESAVLRRLSYKNRNPILEMDLDYQKTSHGWLIKGWQGTDRAGNGMTLGTFRHEVKELRIDPPVSDDDFRIEFTPGMLIRKVERAEPTKENPTGVKQERVYRIDQNGTWHEVVFEDGVERRVGGFSLWWWALALIPVGVLLFWWRSRKEKGIPG